MKKVTFDLIDQCNLKCPSCYHSVYGGSGQRMTLETCRTILTHAKQLGAELVNPFNWGEPLLHKELPQFLELFQSFKLRVMLSSNLTIKVKDPVLEAILQHADILSVSASGLTQQVYERYHKGGQIADVLENLDRLLTLKQKMGSQTKFIWLFGVNRFNRHEAPDIHAYCEARGISFVPTRYYITAIDDILRLIDTPELVDPSIWDPIFESAQDARQAIEASLTPNRCRLLHDLVYHVDGRLLTCCATKVVLDDPLTSVQNLDQLAQVRLNNDFCKNCFHNGFSEHFFVDGAAKLKAQG
ncbi:radical SAM protein [Magnetococcus sp. PR-3]|uniref:radical SAM protein n=1 Tax=Magnetococcus sp. PR-3 TaxID=3120355 RepID=UPI002FCE1223